MTMDPKDLALHIKYCNETFKSFSNTALKYMSNFKKARIYRLISDCQNNPSIHLVDIIINNQKFLEPFFLFMHKKPIAQALEYNHCISITHPFQFKTNITVFKDFSGAIVYIQRQIDIFLVGFCIWRFKGYF